MRSRLTLTAFLLAVLSLLAAACGSDPEITVTAPGGPVEGAVEAPSLTEEAPGVDGDGDATVEAPVAEEPEATADGDDDDEADPTPETEPTADPEPVEGESPLELSGKYLQSVADRTEAATAYRMEMSMSMYISDGIFTMDLRTDEPFMTGVVDGANTQMLMDLGVLLEPMMSSLGGSSEEIAEVFGSDLTMEMIVLRDVAYIRSPFLASLGGELGAFMPELADLAALENGWGVLDASAAGFAPEDAAALGGMQTGSAADMIDLLRDAGAEVVDLGQVDVRGVATTHYRAEVNLGAMMRAQGLTSADLGDLSEGMVDFDEIVLPFDVFIGEDDMLRRVTISLDTQVLAAMDDELAAEMTGTEVFEVTTTIDLFDFDDPTIVVEAPPADQIVGDFTDLFASLEDLAG